ncbi:MAG: hypothetical protein ACRDFC_06005, partial [Ignavibacteria bacterium]
MKRTINDLKIKLNIILVLNLMLLLSSQIILAQNWSALGSGASDQVFAMIEYDNGLIAAGKFTTAGGIAANRIAKWNGSSWSALGSGLNNEVYALAIYNGDLIAAGKFTTAGG